MLMPDAALERIAAAYHRFAENEARGRAQLYELLAHRIAGDAALLSLLVALPPPRRQPNLFLAAVRHVAGKPLAWPAFRGTALARWNEVSAVMLCRSTQTNEPGRCATLLPILAGLPQPLALIEVGASAGLCLLPDRYAYAYGEHVARGDHAATDAPVFRCQANSATPLPSAVPTIAWRAGLDINPLDVSDAEQMAWLETLVWPEQTDRAEHLRAAIRIARTNPPRIVRGDLRNDLTTLVAEAPKDATLVIFHTAVLAYLPDAAERDAFAASVCRLCDYWISNETPRALPGIEARTPARIPPDRFLLAVNGEPVAISDPHGATLDWIAATMPAPSNPMRLMC